MNARLNEQLIDDLVCGTLTGAEYRKAILALEADPRKWRDCALAFLQEQALSQDLTQLTHTNIHWQSSQRSPTGIGVATKNSTLTNTASQQSRAEIGWLFKLGSLAALLLLGFSVGWIGSSIRDRSALGDQAEMNDRSKLAQDTAGDLKVDQMSVDQVLPLNKFGSNNYSFVGNNTTSLLPIDEEIPANLAKLEREGRIRIKKTTAIMPVQYDGGTMLVPVQQIQIIPITISY